MEITVEQLIKKLECLPEDFKIRLSFVNGHSGEGWSNLENFKFEGDILTDVGYSSKTVILGIEKVDD
jgi:plasmid maintenance system antidote protein VapI